MSSCAHTLTPCHAAGDGKVYMPGVLHAILSRLYVFSIHSGSAPRLSTRSTVDTF